MRRGRGRSGIRYNLTVIGCKREAVLVRARHRQVAITRGSRLAGRCCQPNAATRHDARNQCLTGAAVRMRGEERKPCGTGGRWRKEFSSGDQLFICLKRVGVEGRVDAALEGGKEVVNGSHDTGLDHDHDHDHDSGRPNRGPLRC